MNKCFLLAFVSFMSAVFAIADVTSWRNGGNGQYPDVDAPVSWSTSENVAWSTTMPSWGNASPVIVGNRIFVSAEPATLLCIDKATGEILWSRDNTPINVANLTDAERAAIETLIAKEDEINRQVYPLEQKLRRANRTLRRNDTAEARAAVTDLEKQIAALQLSAAEQEKLGTFSKPRAHPTNGYSSFTAVSNGDMVVTCYGTGVVVAYDLDGNLLWSRQLEKPDHGWGGSTSPILVGDKVITRFSRYRALSLSDGSDIWATDARHTFGTPATFSIGDETFLFTPRGEVISADSGELVHDAKIPVRTEWATFNSPVVANGMIYTVRGIEGREGAAYAFEIPSSVALLEREGLRQTWAVDIDRDRYYASPVVLGDSLYAITKSSILQRIDLASGDVTAQGKLPEMGGTAYPSLVVADGKLFASTDRGTTLVMEPTASGMPNVIATNKLEEFRSTPVFAGNRTYIRAYKHLWAIGD